MPTRMTEDRLRRVYELLRELLDQTDEGDPGDEPRWYAPPPPPAASGANLSATDLLNWWFRPPARKKKNKSAWDDYFEESPPAPEAIKNEPARDDDKLLATRIVSKAVWQALLPERTDDWLASEDAESAIEVLYAFLHAFSRGDIEDALRWVSEDYHVIEDDRGIDREGLRCRLESLLESLHGWDIEVSLAAPPEPLAHPYGILIYAEIQIDGNKPEQMAVRSQVERRLVLLQKEGESGWKIAAMARPAL